MEGVSVTLLNILLGEDVLVLPVWYCFNTRDSDFKKEKKNTREGDPIACFFVF